MSILTTDWIGMMPASSRNRRIDQLTLPGSWDSTNVDLSPYRQLKEGIRYLHLEVQYVKDERDILLPTTGYYVVSVKLDDILAQIAAFCYAHPREVILVELKLNSSASDYLDLISIIEQSWSKLIYPNQNNIFYSTIEQMSSRGHRIVVLMDLPIFHPLVWPSPTIVGSSSRNFEDTILTMSKTIHQTLPSSRLLHLVWKIDLHWFDYIKMMVSCYSRERLDKDFNSFFSSFLQDNEDSIRSKVSIISFVSSNRDDIASVIKLNF